MALKLELRAGEKLIINGAVIENAGSKASLLVLNRAAILRGKEILSAEDAQTPASRVHFALQCAYLFPEHRDEYLRQFRTLLSDFLKASPSAQTVADKVTAEVDAGRLYKAVRAARDIVYHELHILHAFYDSLEEDAGPHDPDEDAEGADGVGQ